MNYYTLFSIIFAVTNFMIGFFVLVKKPKSVMHILFFICAIVWTIWSFSYGMLLAAPSIDKVWFWYRFTAIGWCCIAPLIFHLTAVITNTKKITQKKWLLALCYLPGIIDAIVVMSGHRLLLKNFELINGLWFEVTDNTIFGYIFYIYYSSLIILSAFIFLRWKHARTLNREKKQANILIFSVLGAFIPALIINNILPNLGHKIIPAIGYYFDIIMLVGITIAITKYNFMETSELISVDQIVSRIKELWLLVSPKGDIIDVNKEAFQLLGYQPEELCGKKLSSLAKNEKNLDRIFHEMINSNITIPNEEIELLAKNGEYLPFNISGSNVIDKNNDSLGIVIFAFDLRDQKRLESLNLALNEAQHIAQRDLRMAANVQKDMYPKHAPLSENWDISFISEPAASVSGDLFDFYFDSNKNLIGTTLFDVSGHGISSGLITLLAKSIANKNFHEFQDNKLSSITHKINNELIENIGRLDYYLTGILLRFTDDKIEYVNAAHTDLLYKSGSNGNVAIVEDKDNDFRGMLLGIEGMNAPYKSISFKANKDDTFILFTDCLVEGTNKDNQPYNEERVMESLTKAPEGTAHEILDAILADFNQFTQGCERKDDLTIVVIRKK